MFLKEYNKIMINTIILTIKIILIFIILNVIIFIIRSLIYKFRNYILSKPAYLLNIEGYLSDNHKSDCFIIRNAFANRTEQEFKFMLEGVLHLLAEVYSKFPNKHFSFYLVFSEVRYNSDIHHIISNICLFTYNVNNPLTVDELYNLIKFNKLAFINNNKDVVITIKTI